MALWVAQKFHSNVDKEKVLLSIEIYMCAIFEHQSSGRVLQACIKNYMYEVLCQIICYCTPGRGMGKMSVKLDWKCNRIR